MFGNSNLIEALIVLISMGLLNSQIQDMNSHIYTRYQKVFGMRLFLNSCELVFTGPPPHSWENRMKSLIVD